MKYLISMFFLLHILFSAPFAFPEGLSPLSKDILIKKISNPEYRNFIRQYLEFSDRYSSKECLEYGKRTNQGQDNLNICNMFFSDHGLTKSASYYMINKSRDVQLSQRFKDLLSDFLLRGKKYDVMSCVQFYEERLRDMRKDDQLRVNEICKTFFQN